MIIPFLSIRSALQREDIEGFIALGAPADEYDSEAEMLANTLAELQEQQRTREATISALALIWEKSFGRSTDEIAQRMPAFARVADAVLA